MKSLSKAMFPLVGLMAASSFQTASAANGTVNFTGEIVQSTCSVVSGDQTKTVVLGKYPTSAFPKTGATSGAKAFTISLEKCEAGDYSLRFDGNTPTGNPDLLAVTGGAKGVGVEILDNNSAIVPITQDVATPASVTIASTGATPGMATFNLRARYRSFQDVVTAGQANSNATFTIQYK